MFFLPSYFQQSSPNQLFMNFLVFILPRLKSGYNRFEDIKILELSKPQPNYKFEFLISQKYIQKLIEKMEIQPKSQSVEEPKKAQKEPRYISYWKVMLIVINLSLSNFYFGYCLVYISTVEFHTVMKVFEVEMPVETARGILTGCIPFGALFGALLGKKFIHVFSRRNYILFINACALVSGSLLYITNTPCFIIMRIIQGACIGMYTSTIPMTISEISPVEISGSTGAFTQIFCSIGTTSAYLFYYILSVSFSQERQQEIWYYVFGLPLITVSIQTVVLLFVFPYETPKYYLLHHQKSKAKQIITQLYKPQYVEEVLAQKIDDLEESLQKEKAKKQSKKPILTNYVANNNKDSNAFDVPRIASKASIDSALQGVETEEPETPPIPIFTSIHLMILRQFVGINAVLAYGGAIVKTAIPALRSIAPIVLTFETFLGAVLSIYLLAKLGRRTILQGGTFILALSNLLVMIGFFILNDAYTAGTVLILMGLIVFMFVFGATLGSTIWLYTAQICEPSYIILATAITWIFASVVIVFFPILKNILPNQSPVYLFVFFFIWTTLSFIINHKVLIETKGKTEHEIHEEYNNLKIFGIGKVEAQPQEQVKAINADQANRQIKSHQQTNHGEQSSQQIINIKKTGPDQVIQQKI